MNCLLDENVAHAVAAALSEMGHPAVHVEELGLAGSGDHQVLELARRFDVLITFDRFLEPPIWHATRRAMLDGLRIVRLKVTASERPDTDLQLRALRRCWPQIEARMGPDGDARLAIIAQGGRRIRFRTADQIRAMTGPPPQ